MTKTQTICISYEGVQVSINSQQIPPTPCPVTQAIFSNCRPKEQITHFNDVVPDMVELKSKIIRFGDIDAQLTNSKKCSHLVCAYLKTGFLVALLALTVFSTLFLAPSAAPIAAFSFLGLCLFSVLFYALAKDQILHAERLRIGNDQVKGPWYAPNSATQLLHWLFFTLTGGPLIGGFFLPLHETRRRAARWERVEQEKLQDLVTAIKDARAFYKTHLPAIRSSLNLTTNSDRVLEESYAKASRELEAQLDFLSKFGPLSDNPFDEDCHVDRTGQAGDSSQPL
ncbi:MAG: hypothetical protein KGJ02_01145 [Verrucomicrobiota bacterium]|nr:hypothetical protein [Verrucomicrobiota bacterium]